jgi:hypothetical protein
LSFSQNTFGSSKTAMVLFLDFDIFVRPSRPMMRGAADRRAFGSTKMFLSFGPGKRWLKRRTVSRASSRC